jgi:DNA-binding transcriptional MocR family regulator
MWDPQKISPLGPVYVAIAEALARDVREGRLENGERLPTHRQLARKLGVNVVTITRAYGEAARRGLVEGQVGRGTFVCTSPSRETHTRLEAPPADLVDFHFNLPVGDPALLGTAELFQELALDATRSPLFGEYTVLGRDAHRAAGARWIGRAGLAVDPARVIVCSGAQHAMTIVLGTLASPGDTLLLDDVTYAGAKALAGLFHLRAHGVAMDDEGMLPDALATACLKTGARLVYLMPTTHNPTGITMPLERRQALCEVARKHGLTLVEDDAYGPFDESAPVPLAALAPERVFFIAGTSKSLAAGLRIAWLAVPEGDPQAVERVGLNVAATTWMAAPLCAEIAARWITSGAADAAVAWKRREARARRKLFERHLPGLASPSHASSPHVWASLPAPWRDQELVERARRRGVALSGCETFAVGRAHAPQAVRLCLGTPRTRAAVERGLAVLAELLAGVPQLARPVA